ncbi:MAG TPA: fatty acid-binding protein DegV [Lachnospiraceae bacterium]|nr:fatty acid-binding protein DegV [Lachnospiraceae bacterium]
MAEYTVYTDSSCDMGSDILKEWGVRYETLTFKFEDSDKEYTNDTMSCDEFYDRMRKGGIAKTSAVNMQTFYDGFKEELEKGNDVIYIGMSTGLSNTANAASIAADELKVEFPERKIYTIDTLTATCGQGMLIDHVCRMKKEGKSIEEAADYVYANMQKVCVWFIVDDLIYLKRGGRISATAAFAGGVLQLKPVLRVTPDGKLENVQKVRGRTQSIKALEKIFSQKCTDKSNYFICHGSCLDEAKTLEDMIYASCGNRARYITEMSPVIGAHAGPGVIVLSFMAKER